MRTRVWTVLAVLAITSVLPAFAAKADGGSPTYPGSNLQFEMTFTDKDFLPALKQFLPTVPGMVGEHLQGPQKPGSEQPAQAALQGEQLAKELVDALGGLKKVSVSGYNVKAADADKILQFYAQRVGLSTGWMQPVKLNVPKCSFRLYVKPDLAEMFGLVTTPAEFIVVRTEGKIDVAKLAKVAAEFIPVAIESSKTNVQETPPAAAPAEGSQTAAPAEPASPAAPDAPAKPGSN